MPYVPGSGRIKDVYHATNVYANNVLVATWLPPGGEEAFFAAQGLSIDGIFINTPENEYINDKVDADNIDFEDTVSTSSRVTLIQQNIVSGLASGVLTPNTVSTSTATILVLQQDNAPPAGGGGTVTPGSFGSYTDSEYPATHPIYTSLQLTASTPLSTFTKNTTFWPGGTSPDSDRKWLKAQKGLTVAQQLNNLANLASNCYEPIKAKYPNVFVTNTFRQGNNQAQHGTGEAMDIQFKGVSPRDYYDIAVWIKDNIAFDQLLLEKNPKGCWIHISFHSGNGINVSVKPVNKVGTIVIGNPGIPFMVGLKQVA